MIWVVFCSILFYFETCFKCRFWLRIGIILCIIAWASVFLRLCFERYGPAVCVSWENFNLQSWISIVALFNPWLINDDGHCLLSRGSSSYWSLLFGTMSWETTEQIHLARLKGKLVFVYFVEMRVKKIYYFESAGL